MIGAALGSGSYACVISGNTIGEGASIGIQLDGADACQVIGNNLRFPGEHGIRLNNATDNHVADNLIYGPGQDGTTFDGIILEGDSDTNDIMNNKTLVVGLGGPARYGINVDDPTCNCNRIVGNSLGDPASYGIDAIGDSGIDTAWKYPDHPVYGDNFTTCGPIGS